MKKSTKILTLLLAVLLVIPTVFLFSSCDGNKGNGPEGTTPGTGTTDATLPTLEVKNLGGIDIKVLWPEIHADGHYLHNEIAIEGTPSNSIEQAVFERNFAVENAYNVSIISQTEFISTIPKTVRTQAMGNVSEWSAVVSTINFMTPIAQEGWLTDFNTLTHYSENAQPWWNHSLMQDFSIANARYFASGDIIYSDDFYPYCTYVNTAVSDAYQIEEDYYSLVKNKEWTLEKFHELSALVATDYSYGSDAYADTVMHGAVINANFFKAAYYSAGEGMLAFNKDGYPVWKMEKDRTQTILEKAISIVHDDNACVFSDLIDGNHAANELTLFSSNKSLFLVEELIISERLANHETKVDFKVLPFPLYEAGGEYISVLNDAALIAIPSMVTNSNDVCLVLSAMSRESVNTLTPAFFENVLTYRYMQDPGSVETLQIILNSTVAPDVATIQDWGGFLSEFKRLGQEGTATFAGVYDSNIGVAMGLLEEYCVLLDKYYANK